MSESAATGGGYQSIERESVAGRDAFVEKACPSCHTTRST